MIPAIILIFITPGVNPIPLPLTPILSDREAGYDQSAYDECVDQAEELDCDIIEYADSLEEE